MEPENQSFIAPAEEVPDHEEHIPYEDTEAPLADGSDIPPHDDHEYAPAFDPSMLDDQTLMAELQRRQSLHQPTVEAQPAPYAVDPRLQQIVELSYTNPAMAEALRLQIAEERAEARVLERIGPAIAPIIGREAIQNSGLSSQAQRYLTETFAQMPGVDIGALMSNPLTRDVLTRAARQYESERSVRSTPRYESAASEAPTLSAEDWRAIRDFERMTGDRVDSDVIKNARRGF